MINSSTNENRTKKVPTLKISMPNLPKFVALGLFLLMVISFSSAIFKSQLIVVGDSLLTASNINNNTEIFVLSIILSFIVLVLDVIMAFLLYILLKQFNRNLMLIATISYLLECLFLIIGMVFILIDPLLLYYELYFIEALLYSLHLVILGYVIIQSGHIPRFPGILLIFGATLGFLLQSILVNLAPSFEYLSFPGMIVLAIGEIYLMWWFFTKGKTIPCRKTPIEK